MSNFKIFLQDNSWQPWYNYTSRDFISIPIYVPDTLVPAILLIILAISTVISLLSNYFQTKRDLHKYRPHLNIQWFSVTILAIFVFISFLIWEALKLRGFELPKTLYLNLVMDVIVCLLLAFRLIYSQKRGYRSCGISLIYWGSRCFCLGFEFLLIVVISSEKSIISQPLPFTVAFIVVLPTNCVISLFGLAVFMKLSGKRHINERNILSFRNISFQSKVTFHWFTKYVLKAWKSHLFLKFLADLETSFTSLLTTENFARNMQKLRQEYSNCRESEKRKITHWDLYRTMMIKTFGWYMLKTGCLRFLGDSIQFSSPILLSLLISHVQDPETPKWKGVLICLLLLLCLGLESVIKLQYQNSMHQTGLLMKAAVTDYTYGRTLKSVATRISSNIVNVLRIDCECFTFLNKQIHLIWSNPFTVSICIYLLYVQLQAAAFVALASIFIIIVINVCILLLIQKQMKISRQIKDEKLSLVNEVVSSIKQIKFYLLEKAFHINITDTRERELKAYNKTQVLLLVVHASLELSPAFVGITSIAGYLQMYPENGLTAQQLFVSLSILNVLKVPLYSVSEVITSIQESNLLCKRLAEFLNIEEIDRKDFAWEDPNIDVLVQNCTFQYYESKKLVVQKPNVRVQKPVSSKQETQNPNAANESTVDDVEHEKENMDPGPSSRGISNPGMANSRISKPEPGTSELGSCRDVVSTGPKTSQSGPSDTSCGTGVHAPKTTGSGPSDSGSSEPIRPEQRPSEPETSEPATGTSHSRNTESEAHGSQPPNQKLPFQLQNINLSIPTGALIAVIGSVKSGKSSLLAAIAGELEIVATTGTNDVKGSLKRKPVSWDAQKQLFLPCSIQQNILLCDRDYAKVDWERYKKVLFSCALFPDIPTLKDGDQTTMRDVANLSGGQLKRISLARTCYHQAEVYLFDDPLAHMDALSSKHVFENVISNHGMLRNKTRVVVTNDLRFLKQFDSIIFVENGKIICRGTYRQLLEGCADRFREMAQMVMPAEDVHDAGTVTFFLRAETAQYFQQPSEIEHVTQEGIFEFKYKNEALLMQKLDEQRNKIRELTNQNRLDRRSSQQLEEPILRRMSMTPGEKHCLRCKSHDQMLTRSTGSNSSRRKRSSLSQKSITFDFVEQISDCDDSTHSPCCADDSDSTDGPIFMASRSRVDSSISYGSQRDAETCEDMEDSLEDREHELGQTSPLPSEIVFFNQSGKRPSLTNPRVRLFNRQDSSPLFHTPNKPTQSKIANGNVYEMIEMTDLLKKREKSAEGVSETDSNLHEETFNNRIDAANSLMLPLQEQNGSKAKKTVSHNWLKSVKEWIQGAGLFWFTFWQLAAVAFVIMDVLAALKLKAWAVADAKIANQIRYSNLSNSDDSVHEQNMDYFYSYCFIKAGNVMFIFVRSLIQIYACYQASTYFNEKIVRSLLGCDLGEFQKLKRETILQRFTVDIMRVDVFGFKVFICLSAFYQVLALSIVIVYNIPYFILILLFIMFIFAFVERLYARVRKQLIRIKQETTEVTLFGVYERTSSLLQHIRTFDLENWALGLTRSILDNDLKVSYYILVAQKWLILRLYTLGNGLIACVSLYCVLRGNGADNVGLLGIVMNMALQMNMSLYAFIQLLGEIESETVRVEHLREFMTLKQEVGGYCDNSIQKTSVDSTPVDWPTKGSIIIHDLKASYAPIPSSSVPSDPSDPKQSSSDLAGSNSGQPTTPLQGTSTSPPSSNLSAETSEASSSFVLNGISAEIRSGEKVAIVGRSNSGKSSLVLALTRMIYTDPTSQILIDGIDICNVQLTRLREALTIIPQNVLLFKDTLEYNLDPMGIHKRERMLQVLDSLGIRRWNELQDKHGDDLWLYDCEKFKAEGQRQLIGVARGLLNKGKIVILDECTSQLDTGTESLVERVLDEELRDCTVLKITHRLRNIEAYDKVIVMQFGEIQMGEPRELLQRGDGLFHEFYNATFNTSNDASS